MDAPQHVRGDKKNSAGLADHFVHLGDVGLLTVDHLARIFFRENAVAFNERVSFEANR
jgi:hypothetical protein